MPNDTIPTKEQMWREIINRTDILARIRRRFRDKAEIMAAGDSGRPDASHVIKKLLDEEAPRVTVSCKSSDDTESWVQRWMDDTLKDPPIRVTASVRRKIHKTLEMPSSIPVNWPDRLT